MPASGANLVSLAALADIRSGLALSGSIAHDPAGRFQLLLPRHLDEGGRPFAFHPDRHALRMHLPDRAANYIAWPGDVLFVSRGEKNRAVAIESCPPDCVFTSTFFVLRRHADSPVAPHYLAWALNQSPAQAAIAQTRTGAGTPMVQRAEFGAIEIPVPSPSRQRLIRGLSTLQLAELELLGRLGEAMARRNRIVGQRLCGVSSAPSR